MHLHLTVSLSLLMLFCAVASSASSDKLWLLDFKAKIDKDGPKGLLREWNESTHFCSWPGVTCGRRHRDRVTILDLGDWGLKGQLSPTIGNMSFLRVLNISSNSFFGEIPPEIGRLFRLRILNFNDNDFGGNIPANISGCSSLQILRLYSNSLGGRIPAEMGSLSELWGLDLGANQLVGEIPPSFGNISRLSICSLSHNILIGKIPDSLGSLKNLRIFRIGENLLEGNIPLSLYNISTLEDFSIQRNKLEGTLPPDLGNTLPNLQNFYCDTNNFSGIIPASISNASNLLFFQINDNNFFGKVPSFDGSPNLYRLVLDMNNLGNAETGDLNFLSDTFNNTRLENLGISGNNFGGVIPATIGNATTMRALFFGGNKITGNIPGEIGDLVSLEVLELEGNHLTGHIPSTIGKLRMVNLIMLAGNKLSVNIPSSMGNLTSLSKLYLGENSIQGSIPETLGECKNLEELSLSSNNLSGLIPSQLVSISSLSILLDLSDNQLSGSIPSEIGRLVNLGELDVSKNNISGEIPKNLSSCSSLEVLNLQGNQLRGLIPKGLQNLKGVRRIDLSCNRLSGGIPSFLADFLGLQYLNLSFNELNGPVPVQGVFKNMSDFSVAGNTRLCRGLPELKLQTCASTTLQKNNKPSPKTILVIIIICCVVVGLSVVLVIIIYVFLKRKRTNPALEPSVGTSLPRVSYGDLVQATDRFSSSNLIGVGSFSSVYKGILSQDDNKLVAVKVLNLHVSRALKIFMAECESLGTIRHRNLVKLLTVCSSVDFQGNDFKALIYEFMENGNLEEWLHSVRAGQHLSLIQRIKIAIDVATAIDYLHNHCLKSIIHCDIKPSNILLDSDMVARVGDFGLAKLLSSSISNQSSSVGVIRGTVGYVPPEYATGSEVSKWGDIYSFGVLLLELFTAKRPTDIMFKDDFDLNQFASAEIPDRITAILDPVIFQEKQDQEEIVFKSSLISIFEIGIACSSKRPEDRRNISDVVAELHKIHDLLVRRTIRNRVYNA